MDNIKDLRCPHCGSDDLSISLALKADGQVSLSEVECNSCGRRFAQDDKNAKELTETSTGMRLVPYTEGIALKEGTPIFIPFVGTRYAADLPRECCVCGNPDVKTYTISASRSKVVSQVGSTTTTATTTVKFDVPNCDTHHREAQRNQRIYLFVAIPLIVILIALLYRPATELLVAINFISRSEIAETTWLSIICAGLPALIIGWFLAKGISTNLLWRLSSKLSSLRYPSNGLILGFGCSIIDEGVVLSFGSADYTRKFLQQNTHARLYMPKQTQPSPVNSAPEKTDPQ